MIPKVRALVLVLLLATPLAGRAQEPTPEVGPVPEGDGRIAGRVVHPQGATRAAGTDVVLYSIARDGQPGAARTTADAEGRFAFDGIATEPGVVYLVGARFDGVPFVGERVTFAPGETAREVSVAIADRSADPAPLVPEESTLRLERIGGEVVATQVIRLRNDSERVFYATPEERAAGARPAFRAELPEGFSRFGFPYALAPEGVVQNGRDVAFYGPVYAGSQELAFTWALPAQAGKRTLGLRFPSGAGRLSVLFPTAGLDVAAADLSPVTETAIGGVSYRALAADEVAPGARIELALTVPEIRLATDAHELAQARAFLELDDAALAVSQEYTLRVESDVEVSGPDGEPLLRIPLPEEARDVRFAASGSSAAIDFEDDALAVRGPLPPGDSLLNVRYRLPAGNGTTRWDWTFAAPTPIVEVYVADTALDVSSARLHRRRPVRTPQERIFLHFEAFRVDAGETLDLALAPLRTRRAPGRVVRAGVVLATALAAAAFLTTPFLRRGPLATPRSEPESGSRREREGLYEALHDLDHDFETGKVTEADYGEMRADLRRRAALLVGAERAARSDAPRPPEHAARSDAPRPPERAAPSEAAPPAERAAPSEAAPPAERLSDPQADAPVPACDACGAPHDPEARFCSRCGQRLSAVSTDEATG